MTRTLFATAAFALALGALACGGDGEEGPSASLTPKPQTQQQRWYDLVFGEAQKEVYVKGPAVFCDAAYQEDVLTDIGANLLGVPVGTDLGADPEEKAITRIAMTDACKEAGERDGADFSAYYSGTGESRYQRPTP